MIGRKTTLFSGALACYRSRVAEAMIAERPVTVNEVDLARMR